MVTVREARESKWLERATPTHGTLPLGKGHVLTMSPTQGQADIIGGNPIPAISKHLKAFLYGWLPLSNAYGISSLATQRKIKHLRHFHSLRTKHALPDFRIRQYGTKHL